MDIRIKVLNSFKDGYSQVIPFEYTNYIDGLFHISMLCGSAYMAGDDEVGNKAKAWITQLLKLGENTGYDIRNFANIQVTPSWEREGLYWVKRKPQSFAGPSALWWASEYTELPLPFNPIPKAELLTRFGWILGWITRVTDLLNQHVNSMFLAYMVTKRTPPASMKWLAHDNPFYLWIYKEKWNGEPLGSFPGKKCNEGTVKKVKYMTSFSQRAPGSWPAKNLPYTMYFSSGKPIVEYTPTCELICTYLQENL